MTFSFFQNVLVTDDPPSQVQENNNIEGMSFDV